MSGKNLLIGVAIGGILAGAGVILFNQNQKKIKRRFNQNYRSIKNKASEFLDSISVNGGSFVSNFNEQASDWAEKAKEFVEWIQDEAEELNAPENKHLRYGLITAGITIGLLATATIVMHSRSEESHGNETLKNIGNQIAKWKQVIIDIIDTIETRTESASRTLNGASKRMSHIFEKNAKNATNTIHDVIDFASAGLQLWQNIKHR